jgi:hypothetical protein
MRVQGSTKGTKGKDLEVIHSHNMRTRNKALADATSLAQSKK